MKALAKKKKKRAVRTEIDIAFITAILAIYTCL
jgi:hypothetical protein